MAFSFSLRTVLCAVGRNGCPFVFLLLFRLIISLCLLSFVAFRAGPPPPAILRNKVGAQPIERDDFVYVPFLNCGVGHAADDAGVLALREGHAAGSFDGTETLRSVVAHASHDDAHGSEAELLGHRMKQNISRRPMATDRGPTGKDRNVSASHVANPQTTVAGTN